MAVRRVAEPACPSSWWAEPSARASQSDLLSDMSVREVLGQASLRTCRTGQSKQLVYAVLANGDKARAIGQGTASIKFPHAILQLKNSLLVPTLTSNLISLSVFIKNNYTLKSGSGNNFILADKLGALGHYWLPSRRELPNSSSTALGVEIPVCSSHMLVVSLCFY
ncbi:hypothetical protein Pst134EB_010685 [Puccinia striiformis f. sp. tritici]|nr:hypothetical protein Pst134EB_010685 [Puccinia striiformis f. sp. tritici]